MHLVLLRALLARGLRLERQQVGGGLRLKRQQVGAHGGAAAGMLRGGPTQDDEDAAASISARVRLQVQALGPGGSMHALQDEGRVADLLAGLARLRGSQKQDLFVEHDMHRALRRSTGILEHVAVPIPEGRKMVCVLDRSSTGGELQVRTMCSSCLVPLSQEPRDYFGGRSAMDVWHMFDELPRYPFDPPLPRADFIVPLDHVVSRSAAATRRPSAELVGSFESALLLGSTRRRLEFGARSPPGA